MPGHPSQNGLPNRSFKMQFGIFVSATAKTISKHKIRTYNPPPPPQSSFIERGMCQPMIGARSLIKTTHH
ncbi:hypothetical protein BJV74DRAFT_845554 [Russula compacta]|nr:hypothetical protein BJV74DRAFT_845554 [Russula compacta]